MTHTPYTSQVKVGMYVYCPVHDMNMQVKAVYRCESVAIINPVYADRITVIGVDAPKQDFSRPRPDKETVFYGKDDRGSNIQIGLMGKQGEPWAIGY